MNILGLVFIALGFALVCFDSIRVSERIHAWQMRDKGSLAVIESLTRRNSDLQYKLKRVDGIEHALYKAVTVPPYQPKPQEENRFAIRDFNDRDALGRMYIPDTNPHTGSPIVFKWTAIEDDKGRVLYGPKYQHKSHE